MLDNMPRKSKRSSSMARSLCLSTSETKAINHYIGDLERLVNDLSFDASTDWQALKKKAPASTKRALSRLSNHY